MARRKITDSELTNADELPQLTGQQMEFVQGLLQGMTASDAYRKAYDCSGMVNNTLWCEASKLRNDPRVAQWLDAAREAELGHSKVTLDQHIRRLDRLETIAVKTGNIGAAVQAEQLIGKALGHYVERFEDVTQHDPMATLEEIRKHSPDLAQALAREHGISLTEH
jgi:hypothetical protein